MRLIGVATILPKPSGRHLTTSPPNSRPSIVSEFPLPKTADRDAWSVLELLDWITERQELAVQFVSYLAQYIEDGSSAS